MTRVIVPVVCLLLLAGCATATSQKSATAVPAGKSVPQSAAAAPSERPAGELVDHAGDSVDTAVTVPREVPDEARFENDWIFDRFGRFRRRGFAIANQNGRHYDIIRVELPDGSAHAVYFDISDIWDSWSSSR